MAEIEALPQADPLRQPWVVLFQEMVYFLVKKVDIESEEIDDMTQLRQEFEQFKASLIEQGAHKGRAEGKTEGKAEGKAEALLAILAARGVPVPDPVRARILACRDLATLDRWLVGSATAASATEVLAAAAA